MKVKSPSEVAQSGPTLRDSMDCSLPGSSIHEIFQARVLEWGAIAFSDRYTYGCLNLIEAEELSEEILSSMLLQLLQALTLLSIPG